MKPHRYICAGCGDPAETSRPDHKPRYCTVECANLYIHSIPAAARREAVLAAIAGMPDPLPRGTYAKVARDLGITSTAVTRILRKARA
jgi:hypothetical protein